MKQAKIMPWGRCSPLGLSAGVHRNTNVYMLPSKSDCMAPSSAIFWSARQHTPCYRKTSNNPDSVMHAARVQPGAGQSINCLSHRQAGHAERHANMHP